MSQDLRFVYDYSTCVRHQKVLSAVAVFCRNSKDWDTDQVNFLRESRYKHAGNLIVCSIKSLPFHATIRMGCFRWV